MLKEAQRHVTRFIALSNVANPDKKNRVGVFGEVRAYNSSMAEEVMPAELKYIAIFSVVVVNV